MPVRALSLLAPSILLASDFAHALCALYVYRCAALPFSQGPSLTDIESDLEKLFSENVRPLAD